MSQVKSLYTKIRVGCTDYPVSNCQARPNRNFNFFFFFYRNLKWNNVLKRRNEAWGTVPLGLTKITFIGVIPNIFKRTTSRELLSSLSKQEELCFPAKEMYSLELSPLVDSSIILSSLVNDALDKNGIGRSSYSLMFCTSLEIASCTQGSVSKNKFYQRFLKNKCTKAKENDWLKKFLQAFLLVLTW